MVRGLSHVTFSVRELERAVRFYEGVLGFRLRARWYRGAHLSAGELWLCLNVEAEVERAAAVTYDHVALRVEAAEFDETSRRIVGSGARLWQENHSEGESLYFEDPDGHRLEIHTTSLEERLRSLRERPPRELALEEEM